LEFSGQSLPGNLLGLIQDEARARLPESEIQDRFARGGDLVVSFGQTVDRPFDVQVYWRIDEEFEHGLKLDAIISLQTSLLESFPHIATLTQLPVSEAWHLAMGTEPSRTVTAEQSELPFTVSSDRPESLLLRAPDRPWSYFEMTHPTDLGICQLQIDEHNLATVRRVLGGDFQEKGVIRRLRVRGCLLPRENDLDIAQQLMTEFAGAEPPLTV